MSLSHLLALSWIGLLAGLGWASSADAAAPAAGSTYVAMGSSYAAGPGIAPPADQPANRCARSQNNYAHQVAQRLKLDLVDVSCSGAVTANLLTPWHELPAQIDAVTPQTRLVTITIGGNDLSYVGNLNASSCEAAAAGAACPPVVTPTADSYVTLSQNLHAIVRGIREKSPDARIVFVEYPTVLPPGAPCALAPMSDGHADLLRFTAAKLAYVTEAVAGAEKVDVLKFADLSKDHGSCADTPWMTGYYDASGSRAPVAYHPNLAGMTAVADALTTYLR